MARTPKPGSKGGTDHHHQNDDTGSSDSDIATTTAPHTYAIPHWLIPEKQTAKFFSIPLPCIPQSTEQAIRASLEKKHVMTKESTRMIHHISQLQHEEKQAWHKVKVQKERLAQALATRKERMDGLRKSGEDETQTALEQLERNLRLDHDKEIQQIKETIRAQVRVELEQKFVEERDKKRKRDQEEEEQKQGEKEESHAKRQKLDHAEDGEIKDDENNAPKEKSKVEELESKRAENQEKMEKLSEKKSEMFWLLKQVIMQEAKQKMERAKQKKLEAAKAGGAQG
jgi:hypothetical protein